MSFILFLVTFVLFLYKSFLEGSLQETYELLEDISLPVVEFLLEG